MDARVPAGLLAAAAIFIAGWEGAPEKHTRAYQDGGGVWTICSGHTAGVQPGQLKSIAECKELLRKDTAVSMSEMLDITPRDLTDGQTVALSSFVLHYGKGKYRTSTLRKKLLAGDDCGAADEFLRWRFDNGVPVPGLLNRAKAERAVFLQGLNCAHKPVS